MIKFFKRLLKQYDQPGREEFLLKAQTGFWAIDTKGFPYYIRTDERFAYMQSMEERVIPVTFTRFALYGDEIRAFTVTDHDPMCLLIKKDKSGAWIIDRNPKYTKGFGYGYYTTDFVPDRGADIFRFQIKDEVLEIFPGMDSITERMIIKNLSI